MGLIEECASIDGKILQEVLIPTMAVSRRCLDNTVQQEEVTNQGQSYITTAGYKNSFAYEKLIVLLIRMILEPEKSFICGGDYRLSIMTGQSPKDFLKDQQREGDYNEASFSREYRELYSINFVNYGENLQNVGQFVA